MRIFILVNIAVILMAGSANSAPNISSVSGTYSTGQSVTITGSGFGTKTPAAPILWAPFDSSTSPSSLGRVTSFTAISCIDWGSSIGATGGGVKTRDSCSIIGTASLEFNTKTLGIPYYANTYGQKNYFFRKRKMGYTDDVNLKSLELIGTDYTYDASLVFNHHENQIQTQQISPGSYWWNTTMSPVENQWGTEEFIFQANSTAGAITPVFQMYANGTKIGDVNVPSPETWFITLRDSSSADDDMARFNIVYHGDYNISGSTMASTPEYWDDVYVDNTWSRIMLGNNSSFASSTHREMLIPTAWSDTSITASFNTGTFTNGQTAYVFVCDSSNSCNSTGYSVTISGSGGDASAVSVGSKILR